VSLSSGDEVPHIFTRKSRLRPGEFLITSAKRLLQQYLPKADKWAAVPLLDGEEIARSRFDYIHRLPCIRQIGRGERAAPESKSVRRKFIVQIERAENDIWREFPVCACASRPAE